MRSRTFLAVIVLLALFAGSTVVAQNTEQELINKYLEKTEKKHSKKLTWFSLNTTFNRINRHNDYNDFASQIQNQIPGKTFNWLNVATSFGAEFGIVFNERISWSLGGEYWMKMGNELAGTYSYLPTSSNVENPTSEIKVLGFNTSVQYYFMNHPRVNGLLEKLALRVGGTIGYYHCNWDLWPEYASLNLSTEAAETTENTTFKGSAPGFSFNVGADLPIGLWDMALGADVSYLYLNFKNVAWYNSSDEEIVVSLTGSENGRVDLNMSGIRGKIELKRFFSW